MRWDRDLSGRHIFLCKVLFVSLLLLSMSGCSQFILGYKNIGVFIDWKVSGYLKQTTEDKKILAQNIDGGVRWHRETMLIKYANFLDQQVLLLKRSRIDRNQVLNALKTIQYLFEETLEGVTPFIAKVLVRHTSESKILFLEERLREVTIESSRELKVNKDLDKIRLEEITVNFERFFGRLNQAQLSQIKFYIRSTRDSQYYWHKRRIKRHERFVNFLRQRPSEIQLEMFVLKHFSIKNRDKDTEEWWSHFSALIIGMFSTIEAVQLEIFTDRLKAYSYDMRTLLQ